MFSYFILVDGEPLYDNPNSTVKLGYGKPSKRPRRKLARQDLEFSMVSTTADTTLLFDHVSSSDKQLGEACADTKHVTFYD